MPQFRVGVICRSANAINRLSYVFSCNSRIIVHVCSSQKTEQALPNAITRLLLVLCMHVLYLDTLDQREVTAVVQISHSLLHQGNINMLPRKVLYLLFNLKIPTFICK